MHVNRQKMTEAVGVLIPSIQIDSTMSYNKLMEVRERLRQAERLRLSGLADIQRAEAEISVLSRLLSDKPKPKRGDPNYIAKVRSASTKNQHKYIGLRQAVEMINMSRSTTSLSETSLVTPNNQLTFPNPSARISSNDKQTLGSSPPVIPVESHHGAGSWQSDITLLPDDRLPQYPVRDRVESLMSMLGSNTCRGVEPVRSVPPEVKVKNKNVNFKNKLIKIKILSKLEKFLKPRKSVIFHFPYRDEDPDKLIESSVSSTSEDDDETS